MEVMYAEAGEVVAAKLHLERLYAAAERLGISLPWQASLLLVELRQLASYYKSCYLRLTISSGIGVGVARKMQEAQRTVICLPYRRSAALAPLTLRSKRRLTNFANDIKTTNYLESIVALEATAPQEDILWLNAQGMLTETAAANIFFFKQGEGFFTPATTGELLAGVTRQLVCRYLKGQGYAVYERQIKYRELGGFNAAFITSSLQGVRLIQSIDGQVFDTVVLRRLGEEFNLLPAAAVQDLSAR